MRRAGTGQYRPGAGMTPPIVNFVHPLTVGLQGGLP